MGLQITFCTCNLGTERRAVKDPFGGKNVELYADRGLTETEHREALAFIAKLDAKGPDEEGSYFVSFPDATLQFYWTVTPNQPFDVCLVETGWMTANVRNFLIGLSRASNMYMQIPLEEEVTVVTSEGQLNAIRGRFPTAHLVSNEAELKALFESHDHAPLKRSSNGFWRQFMDLIRFR